MLCVCLLLWSSPYDSLHMRYLYAVSQSLGESVKLGHALSSMSSLCV